MQESTQRGRMRVDLRVGGDSGVGRSIRRPHGKRSLFQFRHPADLLTDFFPVSHLFYLVHQNGRRHLGNLNLNALFLCQI